VGQGGTDGLLYILQGPTGDCKEPERDPAPGALCPQGALHRARQRPQDFLEYFDGFSIGSNDLTQLTLGIDRDSALVARRFDERDGAVKALLHLAISACQRAGKYIGICGQGPSDHPDLARWLFHEGIESISLNPDTVVETWLYLAGEARPAAQRS